MFCSERYDFEFWKKFNQAVTLATEAHSKQFRKGSRAPFIAHPIAVASLVLENYGTKNAILAAILHDVVEDAHVPPEDLENKFGKQVVDIVLALTRRSINWKNISREEITSVLIKSREEYAQKIREAPVDIQLVSAADKLHNAQSIVSELIFARDEEGEGKTSHEVAVLIMGVWNKFIGRRDLTIKYYSDMACVYSESESGNVRHLGRLLAAIAKQMQKDF